MLTVGERLKTEREKQGLTLKEVELSTSIRSLYLDAIERDNFAAVPGEVYLKGFIRNYAIALTLEPEELLTQYKEQVGAVKEEVTAETASEQQACQIRAERPTKRMSMGQPAAVRRQFNFGRAFLLCGVVLALLGGGLYWYVGNISEQKSAVQAENAAKERPTIPAAIAPPTTGTITQNKSQNKSLKLEVTATDTCWTEIVADGKPVFSGTLAKGQKMQWEAKEMLRIKLGNAGAIQASMNSRSLPALGKTGEVIERVFSLADA